MERVQSAHESWRLRAAVAAASLLALAAVAAVLSWVPDGATADAPPILPTVNAAFNAGAATCLILGYRQIQKGKTDAHRRMMLGAFALSIAFFVGYLVHHARVGSVAFGGQGLVRTVYFALLVPHILLAAPLVPMALLTLIRGLRDLRAAHRRLARWTLPLWLFVSVSGVVVYAMLYHL